MSVQFSELTGVCSSWSLHLMEGKGSGQIRLIYCSLKRHRRNVILLLLGTKLHHTFLLHMEEEEICFKGLLNTN